MVAGRGSGGDCGERLGVTYHEVARRISFGPRIAAMTKVVAIVAALLAGGALAVSIAAFTRDPGTADTAARAHLAHLQDAVDELRDEVEEHGDFDGRKLSARVRKILACLPEIQDQITGLTPEVYGGDVYLSSTQQISSYCSPVLYGPTTGD